MRLTSEDLHIIGNVVSGLAKVQGRVQSVEVHGYIVELEYQDSQMDGSWYVVTGINKKDKVDGPAT